VQLLIEVLAPILASILGHWGLLSAVALAHLSLHLEAHWRYYWRRLKRLCWLLWKAVRKWWGEGRGGAASGRKRCR
jgi:hypothetical protein